MGQCQEIREDNVLCTRVKSGEDVCVDSQTIHGITVCLLSTLLYGFVLPAKMT